MSNEKRVVWTQPNGQLAVLIPSPGVPEEVWRKDIPAGVEVVETTADKMPKDRLFRKAWKMNKTGCFECPVAGKQVAHEIRRARRAEKFAPHDEVVAKAIPGQATEAEKQRQAIRDADAELQSKLDACKTTSEMRKLLEGEG